MSVDGEEAQREPDSQSQDKDFHSQVQGVVTSFLAGKSPIYNRLRGWKNKSGDAYFRKQRSTADQGDERTKRFFYNMMQNIGQDLHNKTGALRVPTNDNAEPTILDFCMAPGGVLAVCLRLNPTHRATTFTLPTEEGGHEVLLRPTTKVTTNYIDITMLATDMGTSTIPPEHPDAPNFLPLTLRPNQTFHLILCDGQVLRTHARAPYRERFEAIRLTVTQLALGLSHMAPGGTMVVLLHKIEALDVMRLLHTFSQFSSIQVYKSTRHHAQRSSFYMVAKDVQPAHPVAVAAVEEWKETWRVMTFGTEEEGRAVYDAHHVGFEKLLEEFGEEFVRLAEKVWEIQADGIEGSKWYRAAAETKGPEL
ncbi:hypothetical protein KVT40_007972 [Elsinoe batatas]|uniref:Ribosomal RNA methyltransferase FtsJ domain-containing protein n=1 Tax=Elsinoe batatas TaxID=2601811 RepID=A0A8K0PB42_9PEZI|nr:hypothetical protein KVT40_007972 [Elsinoe batatas]